MPQTFDIYFAGQLAEGFDLAQVKETVGRQFKLQGSQLDQLFGGAPVAVKKGVDASAAAQYQKAFLKAGAIIEVRPAGEINPASQATASGDQTAPADSNMTLLPANTGSLIDCAQEAETVAINDLSADLAPVGADLDDTQDEPPPSIDTSKLSLAPDPE